MIDLTPQIEALKAKLLEIQAERRKLDAFLLENRAFIITFSRRQGDTTKRYTSKEILKHSMNLTAIAMRLLRAIRELKDITPIKQSISSEIKSLRNLNFEFDGGNS